MTDPGQWCLSLVRIICIFSWLCLQVLAQPTLAPTSMPGKSCRTGWHVYGNKCYYADTGSGIARSACETTCSSMNAKMLCVENDAERAFLSNANLLISTTYLWLSYNDIVQENSFVWGEGCASTFVDWNTGQPDNFNNNEDCVVLGQSTGRFGDVQCTTVYSCACETEQVIDNPPCPVGWVVGYDGVCYFLGVQSTYSQCASTCTAMDAQMLCVANAEQNTLLRSLSQGKRVWFGLYYTGGTTFVWPAGCSSTYLNWNAGEPNYGGANLAVGMAQASSTGQWADFYMSDTTVYCACQQWAQPTSQPSSQPSGYPSSQPSSRPSGYPTSAVASVFTSKTHATRNLYAFAALHPTTGTPVAWGEAAAGGNISAIKIATPFPPLVRIVAGTSSFLGVTASGGLLGWGMKAPISGWAALASAEDIVASSVVANEAAYAGITTSGAVFAIGSPSIGGDVQSAQWSNGFSMQLSTNIISVTASTASFAALTTTGDVFVWGSKYAAGGISTQTNAALTGCTKLVATTTSFACLHNDGSVTTFGDARTGGDSSAVAGQLTDVVHIIGSKSTFAAFKADTSLVTWGHPTRGGDSSAVTALLSSGIVHVTFNDKAFAALRSDGSVVTWGESQAGGDSSEVQDQLMQVRSLFATGQAFAALTATGAVVTWGASSDGGGVPADIVSVLSSGVTTMSATRRAFAALKEDGSVHVWGDAYQGGAAYEAASHLTSQVTALCANEAAFTAVKADGTLVAWGHMTVLGVTGGMVIAQDAAYAGITVCS